MDYGWVGSFNFQKKVMFLVLVSSFGCTMTPRAPPRQDRVGMTPLETYRADRNAVASGIADLRERESVYRATGSVPAHMLPAGNVHQEPSPGATGCLKTVTSNNGWHVIVHGRIQGNAIGSGYNLEIGSITKWNGTPYEEPLRLIVQDGGVNPPMLTYKLGETIRVTSHGWESPCVPYKF
jgi:hypothetical protein